MDWIFSNIVEVVLKTCVKIMDEFIKALMNVNFDIGYTDGEYQGPFDSVFNFNTGWMQYMVYAGGALALIFVIVKLIGFMLNADKLTSDLEPIRVFGRFALSVALIVNSFGIFIIFEKAASGIFSEVQQLFGGAPSQVNIESVFFNDRMFYKTDVLGSALIKNFISLVFVIALLYQFIKMIYEFYSKYITLGILYYTAPLGASLLTLSGQNTTFKRWVTSIFSNSIVMMLDYAVIRVFIEAASYVFSLKTGTITMVDTFYTTEMVESEATIGYYFYDATDFIVKMSLLLGILVVGTNLDVIFAQLGITTPQSGASFGQTVLAGAAPASRIFSGIWRTGTGLARSAAISRSIGKITTREKDMGGSGSAVPGSSSVFSSPFDLANNPSFRDVDGRLKDDTLSFMTSTLSVGTGQVVTGADANDVLTKMGVNTTDPAVGKLISGADFNNTVASEGIVRLYDSEGGEVASVFNEAYTAKGDAGSLCVGFNPDTGDKFYMPATKELIQGDTERNLEWLSASKNTIGAPKDAYYEAERDIEGNFTGNIVEYVGRGESKAANRYICSSGISTLDRMEGVTSRKQFYLGKKYPGASVDIVSFDSAKMPDPSSLSAPRVAKDLHSVELRTTSSNIVQHDRVMNAFSKQYRTGSKNKE